MKQIGYQHRLVIFLSILKILWVLLLGFIYQVKYKSSAPDPETFDTYIEKVQPEIESLVRILYQYDRESTDVKQ